VDIARTGARGRVSPNDVRFVPTAEETRGIEKPMELWRYISNLRFLPDDGGRVQLWISCISGKEARNLKRTMRTGRILNKRVVFEGARLADIMHELDYPNRLCILAMRLAETKHFFGTTLPHDIILQRHEIMDEMITTYEELLAKTERP